MFNKIGARILTALLIFILAFALTFSTAFAEEEIEGSEVTEELPTDEPTIEPPTEETPEEIPDVIPEEIPEEIPDVTDEDVSAVKDVFTRLWEYVVAYSAEIMSFLSTISICIYAFYQKTKNGVLFSGIRKLFETQSDTKNITGEVFSSQKVFNDKMDAVSEQITVLNNQMAVLIEAVKTDKAEITELKKTIAANAVETMAVLEVLHIGYINNPNIPQSMKNLVTAKYAGVLSKINNEAELSYTFAEMRNTLGIGGADEDKAD